MKVPEKIFIILFLLLSQTSFTQTYRAKNVSWNVRLAVCRLDNYAEISGALIGKAPKKPEQYKRFEKLKQLANEDELYELTNHSNPIIRGYAFWGLVDINSPKVLDVIIKNEADTTMIVYRYGCTAKDFRLIEFMSRFLTTYAKKNNIILSAEHNAIIQREDEKWYEREIVPIRTMKID